MNRLPVRCQDLFSMKNNNIIRMSSATSLLGNLRVDGEDTYYDQGTLHMKGSAVVTKFNLYHSIGKFSRRQTNDIFLIFPSK